MLETVDIQDTDEHLRPTSSLSVLTSKTLVDYRHQPLEKTRIHEFRNTVTNNEGLRAIERCNDLF